MPSATDRVTPLILEQLLHGERRVLSLVVSVGKVLERTGGVKGDLTRTIKSALGALVEARKVTDTDGIYSLAPQNRSDESAPAGRAATAPKLRSTPVPAKTRSKEDRNRAATRKNAVRVEQYLTDVERAHGCAKAWALRERLEMGHVTLEQLRGR